MIMNTREDLPGIVRNGVYFVRWTLISLLMGTVCGLVGTAFGFGVAYSQQFFRENPFMLFLMPVSGILIVLVHKALDQVGNKGTNLILESISSTEQIRFSTLPCIFISTILSHLTGASAGKEGAALQIGGCIGNTLGGLFHMDERDKKVAIMSGMSGCFGAIFGTPLAASMFGMEVISVGVAYYAALVPCVFSAFIGSFISSRLGLHGEAFTILHVPEFSLKPAALIASCFMRSRSFIRQSCRMFMPGSSRHPPCSSAFLWYSGGNTAELALTWWRPPWREMFPMRPFY